MEPTTPERVLAMADAMQRAFREHERHEHGQRDPQPIPRDCLLDVAARLVVAQDEEAGHAVH